MTEKQFEQVIELLEGIHSELRVSNVPDHLKFQQRQMHREEEILFASRGLIQDYEDELEDIADNMPDYTEESFNDLQRVKTIRQRMVRYQKWIDDATATLVSLQHQGCVGKEVYYL